MSAAAQHTPGPWKPHRLAPFNIMGADDFMVASACVAADNTRDIRPVQEANARLIAAAPDLLAAAHAAAATIAAVYQWLDMVNAQGGATSIAGVAKCHAMLKSLQTQRPRVETLVMEPLCAAIAKAEGRT
jgi:hypothetical protein